MMGEFDRLNRYAAALQCIAQDLRDFAALDAGRTAEFKRFAGLLDHMAASLMVPSTIASAHLGRPPLLEAVGEDGAAER